MAVESRHGKFFKSMLDLVFTFFSLAVVGFVALGLIKTAEDLHYRLWFAIAVSTLVWLIGTYFGFRNYQKTL